MKPLAFIDAQLSRITMFRLIAYYLGGLLLVAAAFSALGILSYNPLYMLADAAFLVAVSWLGNLIFSRVWNVPANMESALITGLILSLIITPGSPSSMFFFLLWAALLATGSKYILAIKGKHVFNPAALGVTLTALVLGQSATWWIGDNIPMLPFVLLGGILIPRKIHRMDLVVAFIFSALVSSLITVPIASLPGVFMTMLTHLHFFFAFVMITEPLTTPPSRALRIAYGLIVGALFGPWVNIAGFYFTPETALLAGNVFSYIVSPKFKALLQLTAIRKLADDTYEFAFAGTGARFHPGQYAEWTIPADSADSRGNRRYFTISSSPTEKEMMLGVKFYPSPSAYKKLLAAYVSGKTVLAGSIAGDFTLPRNKEKKLAFIAGGIGVTPFRSMVKYLLDTKEMRNIVMIYSNKSEGEIAYRDVFDAAQATNTGFRIVYTLSDSVRPDWTGERGRVDTAMLERVVPDWRERTFYISGPHGMVAGSKDMLLKLGVPRWRIKTDFFPGFA